MALTCWDGLSLLSSTLSFNLLHGILNSVLFALLKGVFISNTVLHTANNPSNLVVIHKYGVFSCP